MIHPQDFNLSLLSIPASDGVMLPGLLYKSNSEASNRQLVVYVHGAGSSSIVRNVSLFTAMATSLTNVGVDLLCFQNRGAGYVTKFDIADGDSMVGGMAYEKISDFILDIKGVCDWALQSGYEELSLVGHSTGANKLALVSQWINDQPNITRVVLAAGGDDITLQRTIFGEEAADELLREASEKIAQGNGASLVPAQCLAWDHPISWISLQDLLTPGSDYDMFPFGRYDAQNSSLFHQVSQLSKPTLAIYGSKDFGTVVDPRAALDILHKKNTLLATALIPDADHNFTGKERDMIEAILHWMK